MTKKQAVLELFDDQAPRPLGPIDLVDRFCCSEKAAVLHLRRLIDERLIAPASRAGAFNARRFTLTPRGERRLEWYRLKDGDIPGSRKTEWKEPRRPGSASTV